MARKELYEELRIREKELKEELSAIQKLLNGVYRVDEVVKPNIETSSPIRNNNSDNNSLLMPKGDKSWEEYWLDVAKALGGEFKAKDAADIGVRSNPEMDETTVRTSAKSKLSKLYKKGKLNAKRGVSLKEGNTYWK